MTERKEIVSFRKYVEGELFANAFEKVLAQFLIKSGISSGNVYLLRNKVETPYNNEMLLQLYLFRDELDNNLSKYVEHFGEELIGTGTVLMNNIKQIHKQVNSRLKESYSVYESRFYRDVE